MTPPAFRLLLLLAVAIVSATFSITIFKGTLNSSVSVKKYASEVFSNASTNFGFRQGHVSPSSSYHKDHGSQKVRKESLAYMTFLSGTMANKSENDDHDNDHYFVAARLLGYQLLHQPETRTLRNIPFVVLVTSDVPRPKRDRLARDGCTVVEVDYVDTPDWIVGGMPQWRDVMTKLRAWQMDTYTRVLFLDDDMILNRRLDDIFDDTATHFARVRPGVEAALDPNIPEDYLFATIAEANPNHTYPPTVKNDDFKDPGYFNAGFFLFGPSSALFNHYTSLFDHPNIFDPRYPEQNLLNYAHRQDEHGLMPWQKLDTKWNIRFPSEADYKAGVFSMHDKWWSAHMDPLLQPYYDSLRWRMEGYYEFLELSKQEDRMKRKQDQNYGWS